MRDLLIDFCAKCLQELYDSCDKMRPQLFRLASSATEDGDEGLGEIDFKKLKHVRFSVVRSSRKQRAKF